MSKMDEGRASTNGLSLDFMRNLVKQYTELGQLTSAFFWADAAAAAGSGLDAVNGDDIWVLANTLLARGEAHRAAHSVVSRQLHKSHLLCLGVAMRANLSANDPSVVLALLEECDPLILERKVSDPAYNKALAGVLVTKARALSALERRDAAAEALSEALHTDVTCYEALDLLLEQHSLTPLQEKELIESLPISVQLSSPEQSFIRAAYQERLLRYTPLKATSPDDEDDDDDDDELLKAIEDIRMRTSEGKCAKSRRLVASCRWKEALHILDSVDPWCSPEVRATCLVELKKSTELFAFAHTLVDAYPSSWTAWYAVGVYYYLIGKSEFARRYLNKAKSLSPGAGCVWLAYGHSFAADNEHDQAIAAYFKAGQVMGGCHLPPLYVGVECSLLHNVTQAQRFLAKAATMQQHTCQHHTSAASNCESSATAMGWHNVWSTSCALTAHEAGTAAYLAGHHKAALALLTRALDLLTEHTPIQQLHTRWAATLDALGHAARRSEPGTAGAQAALKWHERALSLRPAHTRTLIALALCLAILGRAKQAADHLHAALARDPENAVANGLLNSVLDKLDTELNDEEIPQFPFPVVSMPPPRAPAPVPGTPAADQTNMSDMSMSFD